MSNSEDIHIQVSKIYIYPTEPSNTVSYRFWYDTTNQILKNYNPNTSTWESSYIDSDHVKVNLDGTIYTLTSYLSSVISTLGEAIDSKQDKLSVGNTYILNSVDSSATSADYTSLILQVYDTDGSEVDNEYCQLKAIRISEDLYTYEFNTSTDTKTFDYIALNAYSTSGEITDYISYHKIIKIGEGLYTLEPSGVNTSGSTTVNTSLVLQAYDTSGVIVSNTFCEIKSMLTGVSLYISNGNVMSIQGLATVAGTGDYDDLINKPDLSNIGGLSTSEVNALITDATSELTTKTYVDSAVINKSDSKTSVSNLTSTTISVAIEGNKTYKYGTLNSLTFSSVEDSLYESVIFFTASSSFTTFTYPSTLYKIVEEVTIEAGKSYVVVISNNVMVVSELY